MLSVHNKIWGNLNTIERSTNVHIKIFSSFNVWGMLKNRNYENDNDKLQCFKKTLILKNIKKFSPGKYATLLYVAVSIRWIYKVWRPINRGQYGLNMVLFLLSKRFNVNFFISDYPLRCAHGAKHVWVAMITNSGLLPSPLWPLPVIAHDGHEHSQSLFIYLSYNNEIIARKAKLYMHLIIKIFSYKFF